MGLRGRRHRVLAAVGGLLVVGAGMALTGYGTGAGPLGAEEGGGIWGIQRPVGTTFTTGLPLRHHGWFDAHVESIRPIPTDGAPAGMPLRELTMTGVGGVGAVDGYGESSVPRDARRPVKGYVIPPDEGADEKQYAFALATWEIVESGRWTYTGYEIVYRHGPVRHRMQIPAQTEACTLPEEECDL